MIPFQGFPNFLSVAVDPCIEHFADNGVFVNHNQPTGDGSGDMSPLGLGGGFVPPHTDLVGVFGDTVFDGDTVFRRLVVFPVSVPGVFGLVVFRIGVPGNHHESGY